MTQQESGLFVSGVTDVGMVRDHNEDFISWEPQMGLVMLADGMGGHNAGEVASKLAIESVREAIGEVLSPDMIEFNVIDLSEAVYRSIVFANDEIIRKASNNTECTGMGTTIVVTLFLGGRVIMGSVGDSRIYRVRDRKLSQLTTDHSLVQEMVNNGYLSEEEAQISSSRNLITRALGISDEVEVDIKEDITQSGDVYLLCSDGLTDLVSDEEIEELLLLHEDDLEKANTELVALANRKGGSDNISVILVGLPESSLKNEETDE